MKKFHLAGMTWLVLCASSLAWAQTRTIEVFIDADQNPATGCAYVLADSTNLTGIDAVMELTVQTGATPMVTACVVTPCGGSPVSQYGAYPPPWPVGTNNGTLGADVVEAFIDLALLPQTDAVDFWVQTSDPAAVGTPIYDVLGPIDAGVPVPIPTLSEIMLGVYVLLLLVAAMWIFRNRRNLGPGTSAALMLLAAFVFMAFSANLPPDGLVDDWDPIDQVGTDPAGDSFGDDSVDIYAVFAGQTNGALTFRFDIAELEAIPPTCDAVVETVDEDDSVVITLSGSDPDMLALTFNIESGPTNGSLSAITPIDATSAQVTYTPDPDYNGVDSFTYSVTNGTLSSSPCTVDLTVNAINDCPDALDDALTVSKDTTLPGDLFVDNGSGADFDADGDNFTITAVNGSAANVGVQITLGSGAFLTVNSDGSMMYDPNGQFESLGVGDTADEVFTYTIEDDDPADCSAAGTVTATVTITLTGENDCPTAFDDAVTTDEDTILNSDVLVDNGSGADSDPETDPLTVVEVNGNAANVGVQITLASGALLTVNSDGTFAYDPNGQFDSLAPGENDSDSFTYAIDDGSGTCLETATVNITIDGVNDCPTAFADAVSTDQDSPLMGDVLAANPTADSDPEMDTLTVVEVNGNAANVGMQIALASGALVTVNADGTFTYDPNSAFDATPAGGTDTDQFTYTIDDGSGTCSEQAAVVVTINGLNDCPTAFDDAVATAADTVANEDVLADNGSGADNDPDTGDTINVVAVNGSAVNVGSQFALPSGALLTLNANGTFAYDPNGQYNDLAAGNSDTDSFTYTIDDANAADCSGAGTVTATVTVTINGTNECPTAIDDAVATDEATVLNGDVLAANPTTPDSDPDTGDTINVVAVNGSGANVGMQFALPSGALLTVNANGTFAYDPNGQFDTLTVGQSAMDSFTYTIDDAAAEDCSGAGTVTATVTITISGINSPPVAVGETFTTVVGNTALEFSNTETLTRPHTYAAGDVLDNDSDLDGPAPLTISAFDATSVQGGTVSMNTSTGEFTYLPPADYTGADSFTYTIQDGAMATAVATVNITIADMVWYVDNQVAGPGSGRSTDPFSTLAAAEAASSADHIIYVFYQGDPTPGPHDFDFTGLDSGITLKNGQTLLGEAVDLVVGMQTLYTGNAARRTSLTNLVGDVVTLADDNLVEGLRLYPVASAGVAGVPTGTKNGAPIGKAGGNTTIRNVHSLPANASDGFAFGSQTGTLTMQNCIVDGLPGNTGAGLVLDFVNLTFSSSTLDIQDTGVGLLIADSTGTSTFTDLAISNTSVRAVDLDGGDMTVDVTLDGTTGINSSTQTVRIQNRSGGNVTFQAAGGNITGGNISILSNTGGNIAFNNNVDITDSTLGGVVADVNSNPAINFANLDITTTGVNGLDVNNTNFFTLTTGTVNTTNAIGVDISNVNNALNGTLTNTTVSNNNGRGIQVVNVAGAGSFNLNNIDITTTNGEGVVTNGAGTLNINPGGAGTSTVNSTNNRALDMNNHGGTQIFTNVTSSGSMTGSVDLTTLTGAVTIQACNLSSSGGTGFNADTVNSLTVNAMGANTSSVTANGRAVNIDGSGLAVVFTNVSVPASTNGGVNLNANTGTTQFNAMSITTTGGTGFRAVNTAVSIPAAGVNNINTTNGSGVIMAGVTGTQTFDSVTVSNPGFDGINLVNNPMATTNFGSVNINSANFTGIFAGTAGVVNVTTGTVNAGTARAVDLDNTQLGMTFTSLSSSGGTVPGIDMDTTTGFLTVAGDGSNTAQGGNGSGGTIANKTGANGQPDGIGVLLNNVTNVTLRRMQLNDFDNFAIFGTTVTNFNLDYCTINGANGNDAMVDEKSIEFNNLLGTGGMNGTIVEGGYEDNVAILNTSGTLTNFLVQNCLIRNPNLTAGSIGLVAEAAGTSNVTVTINNSTVRDHPAAGLLGNARDTGTLSFNADNNVLTNTRPGSGNAITVGTSSSNNVTFDVRNNDTIEGHGSHALQAQSSATWTGTMTGTFHDNTVGNPAVADSGSNAGDGMRILAEGSGTMNITVTNNTIHQIRAANGIQWFNRDGSAILNGVCNNNSINNMGGLSFNPIYVRGGPAGGDSGQMNISFDNNVINSSNDDSVFVRISESVTGALKFDRTDINAGNRGIEVDIEENASIDMTIVRSNISGVSNDPMHFETEAGHTGTFRLNLGVDNMANLLGNEIASVSSGYEFLETAGTFQVGADDAADADIGGNLNLAQIQENANTTGGGAPTVTITGNIEIIDPTIINEP